MKLLLVFSVLLFLNLSHPTQAQRPSAVLEKNVSAHSGMDGIYRTFVQGQENYDSALMASVYTEDAVVLAPKANIVKGRAAILQMYDRFNQDMKSKGLKIELINRILERHISKDIVYDVGIYTLIASKDGHVVWKAGGKFVNVARRMSDGGWKEAADSFSDTPAEPGTSHE
jgi:uncharacterized protein (TIGR02246 family)